jgi:hypothetical protein
VEVKKRISGFCWGCSWWRSIVVWSIVDSDFVWRYSESR